MSWPMVKLKDCCTVVGGATPKRNIPEYWDSKDVPWVTPKDISKLSNKVLNDAPEYISQLGFDKCATSLLPKGAVLLTSRAPIGNVAIAGRDMCTNQGFKSLVPSDRVDSTYLYYCMLWHSSMLEALGNGATFKEVSKKIVEEFEIPLPPLDEQKRIAEILDKADAIRQKRKQAIALTDEFLRSVFLEMFGDPVTNPKGFPQVKLTDLADVVTGFAFKSAEYVEEDKTSVRLCRGANSLPGYFDWKDTAYWESSKLKGIEHYKIDAGDVILAMDRPWISSGLKVCVFPENERDTYLVQRVARIRPKTTLYTDYLYSSILSKAFERHCCPTETTVPHISPVELKNFSLLMPEEDLLEKYHNAVATVRKSKSAMETAWIESNHFFDSLSQKAFSGQL
ncbi:restriction endonuclease subunit S [Vibrio cholerae]